jgi:plastocyanin
MGYLRIARWALAPLLIALPALVQAVPVTIDVRGPDGQPLVDAVVVIDAPNAPRAALKEPYLVEQRNISFQPHVLVVPVGATVSFPNRDPVRHHVYSFSKPKKIDLKLYGKEEQRSVVFDKPGVVALGCNIHDSMSGFVFVSKSPFAAKTNATGRVQWSDVPAGSATVSVWSPTIRAPNNMLVQTIAIGPKGFSTILAIQR